MLSVVGEIFFEVLPTSRPKGEVIPTIYLNIRDVDTGKLMGQVRFNKDEHYDTSNKYIRMAFGPRDNRWFDPGTTLGADRLEEMVIGGLIWLSMDNHYMVPKGVLPYMVIHDYPENGILANLINQKTRSLLAEYECIRKEDMYIFDPARGGKKLSEFLKGKQQQ